MMSFFIKSSQNNCTQINSQNIKNDYNTSLDIYNNIDENNSNLILKEYN
jgi:hypothetical protein